MSNWFEASRHVTEAEAKATELVSEAASKFGNAGLQYFIADRYVRAFQSIAAAPNTRLVVVPMEAAGLAGGIVQAMQLFREADKAPGPGAGA